MKSLVALLLAVSVVLLANHAWAEEEELKLLGAGAIIATSPYQGVGVKATPLPIMAWNYKDFYIKGIEAGYRFYTQDPWTVSVIASPRFMGYSSEDSSTLSGMDDRKTSFDAGLRVDYELPFAEDLMLGAKLFTDVTGRHDGQDAELSLSRKFVAKYFRLTPAIGARLQSRQMTDYYYGVEPGEARADRPAYTAGSAVNYFGNVMFNFGIHPKWIVVTRVGVEFLGSEIQKSPIVNKNYLVTGVVGLTRRF